MNIPARPSRRYILLQYSSLLLASSLCLSTAHANITDGRRLFLDPRKGNCTACHQVPNDPEIKSRSKIGPALIEIGKKFPARTRLRAIIWDLSSTVPDTIMPPYGKHRILNEIEISSVLTYLESL